MQEERRYFDNPVSSSFKLLTVFEENGIYNIPIPKDHIIIERYNPYARAPRIFKFIGPKPVASLQEMTSNPFIQRYEELASKSPFSLSNDERMEMIAILQRANQMVKPQSLDELKARGEDIMRGKEVSLAFSELPRPDEQGIWYVPGTQPDREAIHRRIYDASKESIASVARMLTEKGKYTVYATDDVSYPYFARKDNQTGEKTMYNGSTWTRASDYEWRDFEGGQTFIAGCAQCLSPSPKSVCGLCKIVAYCGQECADAHWKKHLCTN